MKKNKLLDPQCLKGTMQVALTNKGELIPCCYLDTRANNENETYKKLLKVSKIKDYEKIEDIYFTKEWLDFANDLRNDKGPIGCFLTCPNSKDDKNKTRKETITYKGKIQYEKKV